MDHEERAQGEPQTTSVFSVGPRGALRHKLIVLYIVGLGSAAVGLWVMLERLPHGTLASVAGSIVFLGGAILVCTALVVEYLAFHRHS